jgi:hypothetical protein
MRVVASSSGIIKSLTDNREDIFTSEGKIKNGIYTQFLNASTYKNNSSLLKNKYIF